MVRHILKDGKTVETIDGYIVKAEDIPQIYQKLEQIRKEHRNGEI